VLEPAEARNKKRGPSCAEAVEDEDSLWKALEKHGEIPDRGLSRRHETKI